MTCSVVTKLYKDRDNAVVVVPYANITDMTNYDMTDVTRVTAHADPIDSTVVGDAIIGDSDVQVGGADVVYWNATNTDAQWRIYCKVGLFDTIYAGDFTLRVTLYDPAHPNGLVLPDSESSLTINIVDLP
jgi:hypothetical protein